MDDDWTLAVDFGTVSTVSAIEYGDGTTKILHIDGQEKMPSMVVVDTDHSIVVGSAAARLAHAMPHRTIRTPKNRLGDEVPIVIGGTPFHAVDFVSALLEHVLNHATQIQGCPPIHCRLTFPAIWTRHERSRLLDAANAAGYPEPQLLAEPIAAALTYIDDETLVIGDHVAVYDLGGGAFDTVILQRTVEGFSVVGCPLGNGQLGGELFDELVMYRVGELIETEQWEQLMLSNDPDWMGAAAQLREASKKAKETLTSHDVASLTVELPGQVVDAQITSDELEQLIMPYLDESIVLVNECIADAGQTRDSIAAIYVIGGASRTPAVEQRVAAAFPDTLVRRRGDPKVAVALGALLAAASSFDDSVIDFCDRALLEEGERPAPPTIEVPLGIETRIHGVEE